jgi:hypothetical protein
MQPLHIAIYFLNVGHISGIKRIDILLVISKVLFRKSGCFLFFVQVSWCPTPLMHAVLATIEICCWQLRGRIHISKRHEIPWVWVLPAKDIAHKRLGMLWGTYDVGTLSLHHLTHVLSMYVGRNCFLNSFVKEKWLLWDSSWLTEQ